MEEIILQFVGFFCGFIVGVLLKEVSKYEGLGH